MTTGKSVIGFSGTVILLCFCCCVTIGIPVPQKPLNFTAMVQQYPLYQYQDSLLNRTLLPFLNKCDSIDPKDVSNLVRCFAYYEMLVNLSRSQIDDFKTHEGVVAVLNLYDDPAVTSEFCASLKMVMPAEPLYLKSEFNYSQAFSDSASCQLLCIEISISLTFNVRPICKLISSGYVAIEKKRSVENATVNQQSAAAIAKADSAAVADDIQKSKNNIHNVSTVQVPKVPVPQNDQQQDPPSDKQLLLAKLVEHQPQLKYQPQLEPQPQLEHHLQPEHQSQPVHQPQQVHQPQPVHQPQSEHLPREEQPQQHKENTEKNKSPENRKINQIPTIQQNTSPKVNVITKPPSNNNLTPQIPPGKADETAVNQQNDLDKMKIPNEKTKIEPQQLDYNLDFNGDGGHKIGDGGPDDADLDKLENNVEDDDPDGNIQDEIEEAEQPAAKIHQTENHGTGIGGGGVANNGDFDYEQETIREPQKIEKTIINSPSHNSIQDPFLEETDSNFFTYFMSLMLLCIILYVAYHNKTKVIALVLEGRRSSNGRGSSSGIGRRKHTAAYRKLDTNLEEAITSNASGRTTQIIY